MNKKMLTNWFWGLFFLACAAILVGNQLNLWGTAMSIWPLIWTVCLGAAFVKSLVSLSFSGMTFSAAFLVILYAKPMGITQLVPWTVLGAALLISIGLELLFGGLKRKHHGGVITINDKHYSLGEWRDANQDIKANYTPDHTPTSIDVSVLMGSATRYVNTQDFQHARIRVNIGEVQVYFDQAQIQGDRATIELLGQIGEVSLFIPKEWALRTQLPTFAVDYSETGVTPLKTGPEVLLTGTFHIGEVTVHYI